jgi:sodium/proline symporter
VISLAVAIFLGIVGRVLSETGFLESLLDPQNMESASKAETLIIVIANHIAEHGLGYALIGGVIIAGILASTMSTADSQLIAASSAVSENIFRDTFKIKMSEKASMLTARLTLIVVAVLGIIIAWNPDSSVFNIVSFAWAGFGAVFGPIMLFSLFWKRTNRFGAIAGMLSGGIMVFVWKYLVRPMGGAWDLYELAPAFLVSAIFIVVFSLLTKAPEEEIQEEFEEVKAM